MTVSKEGKKCNLKKKGIPLILTLIFGGCANTPTIQNNNTMESSNGTVINSVSTPNLS